MVILHENHYGAFMNANSVFNLGQRTMISHEQDIMSVQTNKQHWRIIMWTTPAATEMRFGFEVTMYVMNN